VSVILAFEAMRKDGLIKEIPIRDYVAAVSVGMLEGKPILDLNYDEDSTAEVDMNIIMTGDGRFVEIQGTAEREPFKKEEMNKLISLAEKGIKELVTAQKKVLKGISLG
jgi:ribonuclease PH